MMISQAIDAASWRLFEKIQRLDIGTLPISDYSKKYFATLAGRYQGDIKNHVKTWVKRNILGRKNKYPEQYVVILNALLRDRALDDLAHMTLLDHGGGTGLLSLLAAELGIGQVYYNDIYEISCEDSAHISEALGYKSIVRIPGDFAELAAYCKKFGLLFDYIGSYDVIEHIYDIYGFLEGVPLLCSPKSTVFFYSGANSYNPHIVQSLVSLHKQCEQEDRKYTFEWKKRDSLRAYASIRMEIVKNEYLAQCLPEPDNFILSKLVASTRGLMIQDIQNAVRHYIADGTLPINDARFPSNTCDPITGNWAEHLMDFSELLTILKKSFDVSYIYPEAEYLPKATRVGLYASNDCEV